MYKYKTTKKINFFYFFEFFLKKQAESRVFAPWKTARRGFSDRKFHRGRVKERRRSLFSLAFYFTLIDFFRIICYTNFAGAGFPVGCLCALSHRYSGEGEWGLALSAGFYSEFPYWIFSWKTSRIRFSLLNRHWEAFR